MTYWILWSAIGFLLSAVATNQWSIWIQRKTIKGLEEMWDRHQAHDNFMNQTAILAMRGHYYSTHCLHSHHDECKVTCKHCEERCKCECHS